MSAVLLVVGTVCMVQAQTRDLHSDLADLSIRCTSKHYALAGTVPAARLADFAAALEFIHAEYAVAYGELLSQKANENSEPSGESRMPAPGAQSGDGDTGGRSRLEASGRFRVIIVDKEEGYREFIRTYFGQGATPTRGLFDPKEQLVIIGDYGDPSETYGALFHEAFHQFLDRHIPFAPMWVNEGLATYYETARLTGARLVFDRPNDVFLQTIKHAAEAKRLIPLAELLVAERNSFQDHSVIEGHRMRIPRSAMHYAQSYTLCAFMLSDGEGKVLLRPYMKALAGARSAADAQRITRETFPPATLDALTTRWLQFVNKQ